jgi:serine-type D-Ala-D-Ala carboxypeptidase/endopeptidase (penicillin-binding protein 4)
VFGLSKNFFKLSAAVALSIACVVNTVTIAEARHAISSCHTVKHRLSKRARHSSRRNVKRLSSRRHTTKHAVARCREQIGVLVMNEAGQVVLDQYSDVQFNPASVAKIVTAYGAIKKFGLYHQFITKLSLRGTLNQASGLFDGDVYLSGIDPDFDRMDALAVEQSLLNAGVKQINGRLIVSQGFSYGSTGNPTWSARSVARIWGARGKAGVRVQKGVAIGSAPETADTLLEYQSEPFRYTLKEMLSFSQNHVAEQIGRCAGGIQNLEELVAQESGLQAGSLKLASASGLGRNRVKPRDMMLVLKAFRTELQSANLDFQDVLPLAGIDAGTLDERFTDPSERGSVVAKTGSLPGTDGGTSTLVGMLRSQQEDLYFVIFCWGGNVYSFRHKQDQLIRQLQAQRGGPRSFGPIQTVFQPQRL